MFTGLVQSVGALRQIAPSDAGARLLIDPADLLTASAPAPPRFTRGESIAINGVCLTLADDPAHHSSLLPFDVIHETLRRTSLKRLLPGSPVNLERSATPATLLGGHIVQGHVDGLGRVLGVQQDPEYRIRLAPLPLPDADPMQYLPPKGSITIDGVSLTIASLGSDVPGPPTSFEVALIPTTLKKTTLGDLREGDEVNLEFDAMVKTMIHWLRHFAPPFPAAPR